MNNEDGKTTQDDLAPDAFAPGDTELPDELKHLVNDGEVVGDRVDQPQPAATSLKSEAMS